MKTRHNTCFCFKLHTIPSKHNNFTISLYGFNGPHVARPRSQQQVLTFIFHTVAIYLSTCFKEVRIFITLAYAVSYYRDIQITDYSYFHIYRFVDC